MESRKRKPIFNYCPPSPLPNPPPSSSIFKDISNFKTPKQRSKTPLPSASPQFFTASRNTPVSSARGGLKTSALKSKAARRLKAFELEQSKSARKTQNEKEKSLKSLARSLTVWLNFLFENPGSCGCDPANLTGEIDGSDLSLGVAGMRQLLVSNGKRASGFGREVGVDGPWRGPKRQRDSLWSDAGTNRTGFLDSKFLGVRASLREICSFEDLKERMRMYLNLDTCIDIFESMSQLTKNIDEGRVKMKTSCPIVSDVGMKEKAMKILMCYNPIWLRIGLYILLGGESLLPDGDVNSEQETAFLRMVIENQFFSHNDLAKAYAYNKMVEGLYRPGYYENLGNVILKRFLLLVIILDRAKSYTSLPLKYGIDGLDGGSPLLLCSNSYIKSSRQLVSEFLSSDVMHGEGNLLAHLAIVGYKVNYQQSPLIEYDFTISNLFDDLQDGVRLCRAIELLKHDSSILMKVIVPSDTQKKSLVNCGIALQYLKQTGMPLVDEDGIEILPEDLVNGDKELTLALLWNMFVHLQLPLLLNKSILSEEISNIRGAVVEILSTQTLLDLLLSWIQAVCEIYELKVHNQSSLLDGKAMWCLLDYYFRKEQDCSCSKDSDGTNREVSIMSAVEYTDAVHNFLLTQKLTSLLGNFPEVLQVSDILEYNGACNAHTVIVLLVFLSVQLLVKRNMDKLNFHKLMGFTCQTPGTRCLSTEKNSGQDSTRDFKVIMAWWQDMAQQNGKCSLKPVDYSAQSSLTAGRISNNNQRENAATIIQSHVRRFVKRRDYLRVIDAALILQSVAFSLLSVKKKVSMKDLIARSEQGILSSRMKQLEKFETCMTFLVDRQYFVNLRKSTIIIQRATRAWIGRRCYNGSTSWNQVYASHLVNAATVIQSCIRGLSTRAVYNRTILEKEKSAASIIQHSWRSFVVCKSKQSQHSAATKIQCHYRGWLMLKSFTSKKHAIIKIQRCFLCWKSRREFQVLGVKNKLAIVIQSRFRGWLLRKNFVAKKQAIIKIQRSFRCLKSRSDFQALRVEIMSASVIQSHFRGWLLRKSFAATKHAVIKIQRSFWCLKSRRHFQILRMKNMSAIVIQSHFRGWMARREACREKHTFVMMQSFCRGWLQRKELLLQKDCAKRIQRAFHCMSLRKAFLSQMNAATDVQRFVRGEIARKRLLGTLCCHTTLNHNSLGLELKIFQKSVVKLQRRWRCFLQFKMKTKSVIVIQSHIRGWMARKMVEREKKSVVFIQSYWKGYLARKNARDQLLDLRLRMQKSAANIDDNKRLINRLVAAVSELLSMRSVSGILHTCATLDVATELSQKCCEALVAAGAVGTLVKLIRSVSRSIPDQQVLKHALSTLRNLARYPHLRDTLVESHGCVETVFMEFLRNKEEGYFVASELLKKICASEKGGKIMSTSPAILKRLKALVEELTRKSGNEKRHFRNLATREHHTERRLREAVELLQMIRIA